MFPLPHSCQHEAYLAGDEDSHGNTIPGWADPVAVPCFWWAGGATSEPSGGDLVTVDVTLVVGSALSIDHRDRFTVDGRRFEVIGLPQEYDHGPMDFAPGRQILNLKWVG